MTKLNNSNCDKTQKTQLVTKLKNSIGNKKKTEIMTKLKKTNCD